jgi:CheY-like chemotaxis protein
MSGAPHILIVDDHREIRDLVSRALTKEGFRVSTAADGRAMRKALSDSRIDLVLLDLMLPGEDGLSLCRAVRAESNIPIIMLTAKGDEVDQYAGFRQPISRHWSSSRFESISSHRRRLTTAAWSTLTSRGSKSRQSNWSYNLPGSRNQIEVGRTATAHSVSRGKRHCLRVDARYSCLPQARRNKLVRFAQKRGRPWSHRLPAGAVGSTRLSPTRRRVRKASRKERGAACGKST